jgi:hypothetical protein
MAIFPTACTLVRKVDERPTISPRGSGGCYTKIGIMKKQLSG